MKSLIQTSKTNITTRNDVVLSVFSNKVLYYINEGVRIVYRIKHNINVTTANIRVLLGIVAEELLSDVGISKI